MPELVALPGLFDTIHVVDSFPNRKVFACGRLQGSMLHEPPADEIYPGCPKGPGPIVGTAYQLGWLMAGVGHPEGRGIMIGFGAGTGATALLHHFPRLTLDAVEIDPAMIRVAREFFPLVAHFESEGRLSIINTDVLEILAQSPVYDFALIDISVDGDNVQQTLLSRSFSESVQRIADELWINALTSRESRFMNRLLSRYDGMTNLFSPEPLTAWLPLQRNWIITNATPDIERLTAFQPYPNLSSISAERARRLFADLVSHRVSLSDTLITS